MTHALRPLGRYRPADVGPTPEECFGLWSAAFHGGNPDDVHSVVEAAIADAERSVPLGRNWMKGVQLLRDTNAITDDAANYLLNLVLDNVMLSFTQTDPELLTLSAELHAIESAYGLGDDEAFVLDSAPPDWLAINARWDHRFDAIRADVLRSVGEDDLARMLIANPDEFDNRTRLGREELIGEVE